MSQVCTYLSLYIYNVSSYGSNFSNDYVQDPGGNNTYTSLTHAESPKSVIDAALTLCWSKKPKLSVAHVQCLELKAKQREAEMEYLEIKQANLIMEHKRKMVLDTEFNIGILRQRIPKATRSNNHVHTPAHENKQIESRNEHVCNKFIKDRCELLYTLCHCMSLK